jgi:hypothetical protein
MGNIRAEMARPQARCNGSRVEASTQKSVGLKRYPNQYTRHARAGRQAESRVSTPSSPMLQYMDARVEPAHDELIAN